ncbi:MAG TPA: GntR family transcriptional regulator [Candidatus Stackebrandtia excrementipullorum]|nr:GntR family transcriptional regulator [Candidatus Stackebrandtia excrementipullorum]
MAQPEYVEIAGRIAREIRSGDRAPGSRMESLSDMRTKHKVSDIVIRGAMDLLQRQGLVRSVRRKGFYVSDSPNLVRVSPERQMESAESTYETESTSKSEVDISRSRQTVPAPADLAEQFGVEPGTPLVHTVTRATASGRPASISDTYQLEGVTGIDDAATLEEIISDRVPDGVHADWLSLGAGELVKSVEQRFIGPNGLVMFSRVSYPADRYSAFVFRMALNT